MSTTAIDAEVRSYLSAVKLHLKDLPEDERDDLLEDLEQHLSEVLAEGEGTLTERIGRADAYAAELLASAGIHETRESRVARIAGALSEAAERIRSSVPELRPGWWVLRGFFAGVAAVLIARDGSGDFDASMTIVLVAGASAVFIPISVVLGRRSTTSRSLRVVSVVASVAAVVAVGFGAMTAQNAYLSLLNVAEQPVETGGTLTHEDGTPIVNICAYDHDGKPLENVMLFDEHGRPITNVTPFDGQFRRFGDPADNVYPRRLTIVDPQTGETKPLDCPSVIVTRPR